MDPIVSVQNKNFTGNIEKLAKVLGDRKPEVICTDNSPEFGKSCAVFPGIIVRQHHTVRRLMELLKEQCAE